MPILHPRISVRKFVLILWLIAAMGVMTAQNEPLAQPASRITNIFSMSGGSAHRADTYLTPLRYNGWNISVGYEHSLKFKSRPLMWVLDVETRFDNTRNRARNSTMLGAQFMARWALMWLRNFGTRYELGVGGSTTLDAGALYLRRNGNNPVAANASFTIDVTAQFAVNFNLGRVPAVASYRAVLPVAGVMFTPDYGQLYYEIYMGDTKGLFGPAVWGRYFRLDQMLALDLEIGPHSLRVGYSPDIVSTQVNGIVSRRIDHNFVIGIKL